MIKKFIGSGEIEPGAMRTIPAVESAEFLPSSRTLTIRIDTRQAGIDETTTRLPARLIADGHLISRVSQGHGLEAQVMRMP